MEYLTINTRSNRVVIISSVITRMFLTLCNTGTVKFQPVLIKTLVNYFYCVYCALCQLSISICSSLLVICLSLFVIYLFVLVDCYCCSFILFIVQLFIHSVVRFCSSSILLLSLFVVHCSKEKSSILILDCVPGILILHTTSFMQVSKHHTADCTDFVLV
jgi:hypothetical protein